MDEKNEKFDMTLDELMILKMLLHKLDKQSETVEGQLAEVGFKARITEGIVNQLHVMLLTAEDWPE